MMSHQVPVLPYQKVSADLFVWCAVNYLVIVDHYSDWFEVYRLASLTSAAIVCKCKENFARYGIPQCMTTDGGPQFTAEVFKDFAKSWGVEVTYSTPYHQQANGRAEAAVKCAKSLLTKAKELGEDFEKLLLQYRNTPNKTGYSPAQRLFARRTRNFVPLPDSKLVPECCEQVSQRVKALRDSSKKQYDVGARDLKPLEKDAAIYVKLKPDDKAWTEAVVVDRLSDRVYDVKANGRVYRRDRVYLKERYVQKVPVAERVEPKITRRETRSFAKTPAATGTVYHTVKLRPRSRTPVVPPVVVSRPTAPRKSMGRSFSVGGVTPKTRRTLVLADDWDVVNFGSDDAFDSGLRGSLTPSTDDPVRGLRGSMAPPDVVVPEGHGPMAPFVDKAVSGLRGSMSGGRRSSLFQEVVSDMVNSTVIGDLDEGRSYLERCLVQPDGGEVGATAASHSTDELFEFIFGDQNTSQNGQDESLEGEKVEEAEVIAILSESE
jgi:hypothetical protein